MSQRGALFPWRTIGGEETSAYFPAGTAQYHINADIAHAIRTLRDRHAATATCCSTGGAEVVFETARLWADLGAYIPAQDGAFCINEVTGPDEYTALVNNNLYTNLMARAHLRYAASVADELAARRSPGVWRGCRARIGLSDAEVADWRRAADRMHIPFDARAGHPRSRTTRSSDRRRGTSRRRPPDATRSCCTTTRWSSTATRSSSSPTSCWPRSSSAAEFSMAEKKRNFDYYDPLTTGDSSLSPCIQSVAAAELGYAELAYALLLAHGADGPRRRQRQRLRTGCTPRRWPARGSRSCTGSRASATTTGRSSFAPRLPAAWSRLRFRLRLRGALLAGRRSPGHDGDLRAARGRGASTPQHFGRAGARRRPAQPATVDLRPAPGGVIFDLDGVLTDTAEHHFRAWQRLADEVSLPFDRELNERLKGVSRMESLEIILEHAGRRPDPAETVRLAERKNAYFRELIAGITPADLLPGIGELLAELRRRGVRTAIASMSHNASEVRRPAGHPRR